MLAAAVGGYNGQTGYIYTSTDGGVTWTERTTSGQRNWTSITSSADGLKLTAVGRECYIYTSTDGGVTWIERKVRKLDWDWIFITSSADGHKLAALGGGLKATSISRQIAARHGLSEDHKCAFNGVGFHFCRWMDLEELMFLRFWFFAVVAVEAYSFMPCEQVGAAA